VTEALLDLPQPQCFVEPDGAVLVCEADKYDVNVCEDSDEADDGTA
jgi:hypothetical protein